MALMDTLSLWLQPGKNEVSQQAGCCKGSHTAHTCSLTPTVPSSAWPKALPDPPPIQLSAALSAFYQLLSILTSALLCSFSLPLLGMEICSSLLTTSYLQGILQTTHQYYFSKS